MKHISTEFQFSNLPKILELFELKYKNSQRIGLISKIDNPDFYLICDWLNIKHELVKTLVFTNLKPGESSGIHSDGELHHTGLFIPLSNLPIKFNWWDITNCKTEEMNFYDVLLSLVVDANQAKLVESFNIHEPTITNVELYHNVTNDNNVNVFGISIRLVNDFSIENITVDDYLKIIKIY